MEALKFITCGSVDDGKSTLIGRLLVDSQSVLSDQLAGVQRQGQTDLALLTDGLSAEREQGITIDVAYRYFSTQGRKFIIGDAPGHEQYTRNMVTAASSADAAVVLVDATKLDTRHVVVPLLPQTRRHSLLAHLLRVPSIVFAVNKLDAVDDAPLAFARIRQALLDFSRGAGIEPRAIVPISALKGWNVAEPHPEWCGYRGPHLLALLESLPNMPSDAALPMAFPVQWVEKNHDSAQTQEGRRVFWGRLAAGTLNVGQTVRVFPGGQTATVARLMDAVRREAPSIHGHSAGVVLDREVDVSRGDWLLADTLAIESRREWTATVAWMDDTPLTAGRVYWAMHGRRWVKARVTAIEHRLDIQTLQALPANELKPNEIGRVRLQFQQDMAALPYDQSRGLGAMVLVDTASHRTSAAVLIDGDRGKIKESPL
ncbi:MAG: Sulfate adenylyltransferase subunit 1 [Pseudomonadota bacterium]|jgi:sulfate adenylyltransferase subunit 1